jgi:hypothetical protein
MKFHRKARWLIILTLMVLLVVGGAGAVAAAGNQHGSAFRRIAHGNFGAILRHKGSGHADYARHTDLFDKEAIAATAAQALGVNPDELKAAAQEGRDSVQALLEAAGLELSDVKTAVDAEIESQLAAAVEAGTLTQDEMDAILSRNLERMGFGKGHRGSFGHRMLPTDAIDVQAVLQAAAVELGLDAENLLAALTEGRSAADAFLEANDTDLAEFKAALDTAWQQAIADAVESGTLTEEQADHLNRKGYLGRGFDGGRHHGRHGHGWQRGFGHPNPTGDNA